VTIALRPDWSGMSSAVQPSAMPRSYRTQLV
jgi:hypothetical protein